MALNGREGDDGRGGDEGRDEVGGGSGRSVVVTPQPSKLVSAVRACPSIEARAVVSGTLEQRRFGVSPSHRRRHDAIGDNTV